MTDHNDYTIEELLERAKQADQQAQHMAWLHSHMFVPANLARRYIRKQSPIIRQYAQMNMDVEAMMKGIEDPPSQSQLYDSARAMAEEAQQRMEEAQE